MKKLMSFSFDLPDRQNQELIVDKLDQIRDLISSVRDQRESILFDLVAVREQCLSRAFADLPRAAEANDADWITALATEVSSMTAEDGLAARGRRKAANQPRGEVDRSQVGDDHLARILVAQGVLTAASLWAASSLSIDDFYEQLRDEISVGSVVELKDDDNAVRLGVPT